MWVDDPITKETEAGAKLFRESMDVARDEIIKWFNVPTSKVSFTQKEIDYKAMEERWYQTYGFPTSRPAVTVTSGPSIPGKGFQKEPEVKVLPIDRPKRKFDFE